MKLTTDHATQLQRLRALLQPAPWFVVVAAVFGLLFTFITAPMNVPDETNHFLRAWQVSEGHFLPEKRDNVTGGTVPVSVINLEGWMLAQPHNFKDPSAVAHIKTDSDQRDFMRFENTALYSPVMYAPQAVGIVVGRLLDLPILNTLYLARIFNLAVYIVLIYWTIRLIPFGKWATVIIGLLPMHLLLAGSLSSDALSTGLLLFTVALVLRLRTMHHTLRTTQLGWLLLLAIIVSLSKPPLQLVLGLYLLLPRNLFGTVRRQWIFYGLAFALAAGIGGGWLITAKSLSSDYGPLLADDQAQLDFIVAHPVDFATAVFKTYFTSYSNGFLNQYVLSVGWLETWLPYWATFAYTALVAMALWPIRAAESLGRWQKVLILTILLACFLAINTLVYLSWSAVGTNRIDGIQMRYFTPLAILLVPILAVRSNKKAVSDGFLPVWVFRLAPVAFLILSLMLVISWTYSISTPLT